MTTHQSISLNRLVQSKANVRRTARTTGIDELMASIAAHGLRQNLNVRPTTGGRFEVVAGGRRLIALKKLARLGTIAADAPVSCLVLDEADNPTEISLAENWVRRDMHPDDQCEAFRSLIEAGQPVEDVAARFGVSPALVRQRLKLASVSPKLRALYRAGDTTLAHLMAVTLTDDHAAQEAAFASAYSADHIRRLLTDGTEEADSRLAVFVGLDAYVAAGGGIVTDLFHPEDSYLTDAALLHRLALAKLAEAAKLVEAEGWAWVTTELARDYAIAYQRIYGEQDDEGGDNEGGTERFTPEQMAMAGARLSVSYDGELEIGRGLVRREDCIRSGAAEGGKAAAAARPDYSAALLRELTAHRTAALRSELATRPDIALAAVVHSLVLSHHHAGSDSCLGLSLTSRSLERDVQATADCDTHHRIEALGAAWQERLPEEPEALWRWCLAQPQEVLLDLLALLAALSIDAVEERPAPQRTAALAQSDRLAEALALDMTTHWQATPDFLARLSKPVLAQALTETGKTLVADNLGTMKKDAAVRYAHTALADTGWLPPALQAPQPTIVDELVEEPAALEAYAA